ncbi:MAG: hypothetical protein HY818_13410 [Acetobacterium woodii]|nr:hypothetical protein [Acetobacterium woodii]
MNQIKRKRRLSALEAAVLGNILYIVIVLIYKNVFDAIRTSDFNYLFNAIQFITVGAFWIALFAICFKSISANEKPRAFKYIVFSLIPIVTLTVALTLVSTVMPGQDTSSIWNQFAFIAAPTIFWYLPFGLIYQLIGSQISIFAFFGIALIFTVAFQMIGIITGRILGRKYYEETRAEDERDLEYDREVKKEKKKTRKKPRMPKRESIGMEGLSNEQINEGFTPMEPETMNMTEVIIEDTYVAPERTNYNKQRRGKSETGLFEKVDESTLFNSEKGNQNFETEIKPAAMPEIMTDQTVVNEQAKTIDDWQLSHPIGVEDLSRGMNKHEETDDKSFLMETSAVRIIKEEDIEEYYRNKK